MASLDEKQGVYVVVGTGGGGGPDTAFLDREAASKKKKEKADKAKRKEADRAARQRIREEKAAARVAEGLEGDDDDEELETESEEEDLSESEDEAEGKERGYGLNRFGTAFNDVIGETGARVRVDSFEHCVVEVKKEDLGGFLEALSMKAVVG